mmetsp:Transcript_42830/g.98197  ORF Transcript_42830/g.98197 Transcript_42830/m.98197 type:complete len:372 (+) Transcript_42830:99-1214(+)
MRPVAHLTFVVGTVFLWPCRSFEAYSLLSVNSSMRKVQHAAAEVLPAKRAVTVLAAPTKEAKASEPDAKQARAALVKQAFEAARAAKQAEIQKKRQKLEELEGKQLSNLVVQSGKTSDWLCPLKRAAADIAASSEVTKALLQHFGMSERPKTCAVVSNSGVLLNHTHGKDIDAADLVFRFNDAEVGGALAEHVGERDDVRILNGNFQYGLFWPRAAMALNNRTFYIMQRLDPSNDDGTYEALDEKFRERPWLHVVPGRNEAKELSMEALVTAFGAGARNPTTGFQGGITALGVCDEVLAFGFPETPNSPAAPFHYFGDLKQGSASQNEVHATAKREKLFWRGIAANSDVDSTDIAAVPGFRKLQCEEEVLA